jgi:hypothetical protein
METGGRRDWFGPALAPSCLHQEGWDSIDQTKTFPPSPPPPFQGWVGLAKVKHRNLMSDLNYQLDLRGVNVDECPNDADVQRRVQTKKRSKSRKQNLAYFRHPERNNWAVHF